MDTAPPSEGRHDDDHDEGPDTVVALRAEVVQLKAEVGRLREELRRARRDQHEAPPHYL